MTDHNFIEFCYQRILRRKPDEQGEKYYLRALDSGSLNRGDMLLGFLTCEEFESSFSSAEFVPTGHFYSAIPSSKERESFLANYPSKDEIKGIQLRTKSQIDLLKKFKKYYTECPLPEYKSSQFRYFLSNPAYTYTDGLTLYSMIRHFKPKNIIEIGSGYSSSVMLDTSDHFFNGEINIKFIEPFPKLLKSLMRRSDKKHTIISKKLQDVEINTFSNLEANDILFVDSTHVSKLNSDVNMIFFEILPVLQPGVLIHFHDIFWPFEYPKNWIREGRAWNEAYILRAFLQYNQCYEIEFFGSYLHSFQQKWFQMNMPLYQKNTGGNIWIRKISK